MTAIVSFSLHQLTETDLNLKVAFLRCLVFMMYLSYTRRQLDSSFLRTFLTSHPRRVFGSNGLVAGFGPCGREVLEVTCELWVSGSGTLKLRNPELSCLSRAHDLDDWQSSPMYSWWWTWSDYSLWFCAYMAYNMIHNINLIIYIYSKAPNTCSD